MGKKGQYVWTDGNDAKHISKGVYDAYTQSNLRYSQVCTMMQSCSVGHSCRYPPSTCSKRRTPAATCLRKSISMPLTAMSTISRYARTCNHMPRLIIVAQFIAKGGGSANKTYLFQQTKVRTLRRSDV